MANYAIEDVLPHDHPMILLDQLLSFEENSGLCKTTITEHSQFYDASLKAVPSYVGLEYMAQGIAAYANANQLSQGEKVEIGFLVSTRKYKPTMSLFPLGTELVVHVEKLYRDDSGLSAFDCTLLAQQQVVATARINVFQPNNPEDFIAEQLKS